MEREAKFKTGSEVWTIEENKPIKVSIVDSWEDDECYYGIEGLFLYRCYSKQKQCLTRVFKESEIFPSRFEAVLSLLTGMDITLQVNESEYVLTIKKEVSFVYG